MRRAYGIARLVFEDDEYRDVYVRALAALKTVDILHRDDFFSNGKPACVVVLRYEGKSASPDGINRRIAAAGRESGVSPDAEVRAIGSPVS